MTDTTDEGVVAPAGAPALPVRAAAADETETPVETGAGALAALGESVAARLAEDFAAHGEKLIADLRTNDPKAYVALLAKLLPEPERREDLLTVQTIMLIGRP